MTNEMAAPAEPGYCTDDWFVYRFLPADVSVGNLAYRFGTDVAALCALNEQAPDWHPYPGEILRIPRPAEPRPDSFAPPGSSWQQYDIADAGPLSTLLEKLSGDGHLAVTLPDSGMPGSGVVSREEIARVWHYWRNARLRENVLLRTPGAAGTATGLSQFVGEDGASLSVALPQVDVFDLKGGDACLLNRDESIFLPLTPLAEHSVAVAPNAVATVDTTVTALERARRGLAAIDRLMQALTGLRARSQAIQAECTACLRIAQQLDVLLDVEQRQYDSTTYQAAHLDGYSGDDGRADARTALRAFAKEAPKYLLADPQKKIDTTLSGSLALASKQLFAAIKDKDQELRRQLDVVLPASGEVLCVLDGRRDPKNFVATLCSVVGQAAYWVAESGTAEATGLLDDAAAAMVSGKKPSADTTTSLLDYTCGLVAAGASLTPSAGGELPLAYCGVVSSLYLASGLATKSVDLDVCASRVSSAVSNILGIEISTYVPRSTSADAAPGPSGPGLTGAQGLSKAIHNATAAAPEGASAQVADMEEATKATERSWRATAPSTMDRAATFFEDPEKMLGSLGGPIGNLKTLWKLADTMRKLPGYAATIGPDPTSLEGLRAILQAGKATNDIAAAGMKLAKNMGLVEGAVAGRALAVCGKVTGLVAIVLELVKGEEAFRVGDQAKGTGSLLAAGGGMLLFLAGGPWTMFAEGVFVFVGATALILGNIIESTPEFFTLESGTYQFFQRSWARVGRSAEYFPDLHEFWKRVDNAVKEETLPVLDEMQSAAYGEILRGAGFAANSVTN